MCDCVLTIVGCSSCCETARVSFCNKVQHFTSSPVRKDMHYTRDDTSCNSKGRKHNICKRDVETFGEGLDKIVELKKKVIKF